MRLATKSTKWLSPCAATRPLELDDDAVGPVISVLGFVCVRAVWTISVAYSRADSTSQAEVHRSRSPLLFPATPFVMSSGTFEVGGNSRQSRFWC
ncbi:hypothetical protein PR002_g6248 [Phytophthora rubi]|uniref:Uncharacterized protein n=1 Tax=Phytophthora rubi TaxID=129364 RepID=A0A6A3MXT7_9STRA|nr:hypothetical protein PR002_g6248 [Phytophthora rubi]